LAAWEEKAGQEDARRRIRDGGGVLARRRAKDLARKHYFPQQKKTRTWAQLLILPSELWQTIED
jgi:hypothetical protein